MQSEVSRQVPAAFPATHSPPSFSPTDKPLAPWHAPGFPPKRFQHESTQATFFSLPIDLDRKRTLGASPPQHLHYTCATGIGIKPVFSGLGNHARFQGQGGHRRELGMNWESQRHRERKEQE